jgi:FixJ family two-component response regulator
MVAPPLVTVVDDDVSVREALSDLLRQFGLKVAVFSSSEQFLASGQAAPSGCLILDVTMPGMSGPNLQRELVSRGCTVPVIFITAQRDERMRARMLEQGAVECLFKPFSDTDLLRTLRTAFQLK